MSGAMLARLGLANVRPERNPTPPVASIEAELGSDQSLAIGRHTLSFGTSVRDVGWGWSAGTSDFIIPTGVSVAIVNFHSYSPSANLGNSVIEIHKNGATVANRFIEESFWAPLRQRLVIDVVPGDTISIDIEVFDSGISLRDTFTRITLAGY